MRKSLKLLVLLMSITTVYSQELEPVILESSVIVNKYREKQNKKLAEEYRKDVLSREKEIQKAKEKLLQEAIRESRKRELLLAKERAQQEAEARKQAELQQLEAKKREAELAKERAQQEAEARKQAELQQLEAKKRLNAQKKLRAKQMRQAREAEKRNKRIEEEKLFMISIIDDINMPIEDKIFISGKETATRRTAGELAFQSTARRMNSMNIEVSQQTGKNSFIVEKFNETHRKHQKIGSEIDELLLENARLEDLYDKIKYN